jgi:hypothetical protein
VYSVFVVIILVDLFRFLTMREIYPLKSSLKFTDHSYLKYLINKPVLGGIICRWLLFFLEFDFEVIVKPGKLNARPNHLSRITNGEEPTNLEDNFPDAQLFSFQLADENFTDII